MVKSNTTIQYSNCTQATKTKIVWINKYIKWNEIKQNKEQITTQHTEHQT